MLIGGHQLSTLRIPAAAITAGVTFEDRADDLWAVAYRAAYPIVGARAEVEDVAQEALIRAHGQWKKINGYAEPWVARVATNLALDALRRANRRRDPITAEVTYDPDTSLRIVLQEALDSLGKREREVVLLRYFADLAFDDVAGLLGVSTGTVKRYSARGLDRLRVKLGHRWEELA